MRSVTLPCGGGSDARPTWAKRPVKMLEKKSPGDVVKRERIIVNVKDTKSSSQRASLASQVVPEWKVKDEGKFESNPKLSIPFLAELW